MIAAPRSGSGKTTIALGLLRAFRRRGLAVVGLKSGPDYIDPAFHAAASGVAGRQSRFLGDAAGPPCRAGGSRCDRRCAGALRGLDGTLRRRAGPAWPQRRLGRRRRRSRHAGAARRRRLGPGAVGGGRRQGLCDLRPAPDGRRRHAQPRRQRAASPPRGRSDRGARRSPSSARCRATTSSACRSATLGSSRRARRRRSTRASTRSPTSSKRHVDCDARDGAGRRIIAPRATGRAVALGPPGQRIALARDEAFSFIYPHVVGAGARRAPRSSPSRRSRTSRRQRIATCAGCPAAIPSCTPGGSPRRNVSSRGCVASRGQSRRTASAAATWRSA